MATRIQLNSTAAALLGLLREGPATGGQLMALAEERYSGYFGLTRSQVYRELPALTEAGLLRLGKLGARSSQQYVITAAGRRAFKAWLGQGDAVAAVGDTVRSPLILRLANAGDMSERHRNELLETAQQAVADRLAEAKATYRAVPDPYDKAVAEFTVNHYKALAKLVDRIMTI
ncbi:helix-turn-helix transcriptional regulator [Rhodococcus sp. X156]|uniref:PadR family transcriptional regulator n=1 Tax=Rhodococcus sp. X156 TaxID=2499145 RepID=UPI000FD9EE30|nr:helix-turn-helix transcriptional regulator [Rhodococcus sp. X156]